MATEEVMIDYDMQTPEKKKANKVASMKNNVMYEAPNPFRNKAELMEYRKKIEKLYRPGYGEMGRKERPSSEMIEMLEKKSITPKSKSKTNVMKKLGSAAGKVIDKLDDKSIKETMLKQNALMPLSSKPMERELPHLKSEPKFESVMASKETPMDEKKSKLESLKKPATKKSTK